MARCYKCGQRIEFRYVGGALRPIHVDGGWCDEISKRDQNIKEVSISRFKEFDSYLNPNARCPVCGDLVFFYRSPFGGRVFFDDLGWPWPKHPCTDNAKISDRRIYSNTGIYKFHLKDKEENEFDVFVAEKITNGSEFVELKLRNVKSRASMAIKVMKYELKNEGIDISDLQATPSFVIAKNFKRINSRKASFICDRLGKISSVAFSQQSDS